MRLKHGAFRHLRMAAKGSVFGIRHLLKKVDENFSMQKGDSMVLCHAISFLWGLTRLVEWIRLKTEVEPIRLEECINGNAQSI